MKIRGAHFFRVLGRLQPGITSAAGERGGKRDRGSARKRVSRHQYRSQREGCFLSSGSGGRRASGACSCPGGGFLCSPHCLRQCGQPAPRPRHRPSAGDRDPHRARRLTGPARSATPRRRSASGIVRRGRRPPARLVERRSAAHFRSANLPRLSEVQINAAGRFLYPARRGREHTSLRARAGACR